MNDLKEVEKLITNFGLSMREAKVYTTLFRKRDFTASEIQQLAGIPRTKVYEVLHQLISKGMCAEKKIGRLKKYEAVNPASVFDKLLKDLAAKENIANNVLKILSPLYEEREEKDNPLEYIEIVKDREQIRKKWLNINENAKKEILIFTKPPYASSPDEAIAEEKKLLKTNNRRRMNRMDICEYKGITSESGKNEFIKMVSALISNEEEVRIVKELPMKLAIFDERITMLALNDPISLKPSITTMIINHPSFAMAQKKVFESIWKEAMTLEEYKDKGG